MVQNARTKWPFCDMVGKVFITVSVKQIAVFITQVIFLLLLLRLFFLLFGVFCGFPVLTLTFTLWGQKDGSHARAWYLPICKFGSLKTLADWKLDVGDCDGRRQHKRKGGWRERRGRGRERGSWKGCSGKELHFTTIDSCQVAGGREIAQS